MAVEASYVKNELRSRANAEKIFNAYLASIGESLQHEKDHRGGATGRYQLKESTRGREHRFLIIRHDGGSREGNSGGRKTIDLIDAVAEIENLPPSSSYHDKLEAVVDFLNMDREAASSNHMTPEHKRQIEAKAEEAREKAEAKAKQKLGIARWLWNREDSKVIAAGSLGERYFRNARGIKGITQWPEGIKFNPSVKFYRSQKGQKKPVIEEHPAVLVKLTGPEGDFRGIEQIPLTKDGRKLVEEKPEWGKKGKFYLGGAEVEGSIGRLYEGRGEDEDTLVICEGLETGLSFYQKHSAALGHPALWITRGTDNMYTLEVPKHYTKILIGADRGIPEPGEEFGSGGKAAKALKKRLLDEMPNGAREVKVLFPKGMGCKDFNDELTGKQDAKLLAYDEAQAAERQQQAGMPSIEDPGPHKEKLDPASGRPDHHQVGSGKPAGKVEDSGHSRGQDEGRTGL